MAGVLGGENSSVREIKRVRGDSYTGDQRRQSAFYIAASFLGSNSREQREKTALQKLQSSCYLNRNLLWKQVPCWIHLAIRLSVMGTEVQWNFRHLEKGGMRF